MSCSWFDLRVALNPVGFLSWKRISLRKVSFAFTFAVLMKSSLSDKRADVSLFFWFWAGFVLDKEDRSITRSNPYFKELFRRCGLHLYQTKVEFMSVSFFHLKTVSRNCWFRHLCFFLLQYCYPGSEGSSSRVICCKNVCFDGWYTTQSPQNQVENSRQQTTNYQMIKSFWFDFYEF